MTLVHQSQQLARDWRHVLSVCSPRPGLVFGQVLLGIALTGVSLSMSTPNVGAEDPAQAETTEAHRAQRLKLMQRHAADYELHEAADEKQRLILQEKPVLRWSNPVRETDDGAMFLWTTESGLPAAILSIYTHEEKFIDHEFQSIAPAPTVAQYRGAPVWRPEKAGMSFRALPGSPPAPAELAALRLSQMRKMLGDFSASMGRDWWRNELRMLRQPIYRYGDERGDVLDGAVFDFGQGTDPELLVTIEACRDGISKPNYWRYAPARLNMGTLELKHNDSIVWSIEDWNHRLDPAATYITFVHRLNP
jgi:hypothetical protein